MSDPTPAQLEPIAQAIFSTALRQNRAGELLACLHGGGTATITPQGELMMIPGDLIQQLVDGDS